MNWLNKHQEGAVVYNADGTVQGTQRGRYVNPNEKPKGMAITAPTMHKTGAQVYDAYNNPVGTQTATGLASTKPAGYDPSKGPLSAQAYGAGAQYDTSKGPLSAQAYDAASKPAAPAWKPPRFSYNNQQVTEAEYRRLTANNQPAAPAGMPYSTPAASTPAPAAIAKTGAAEVYGKVDALGAKREAEIDALKTRITDASNPYGIDTEGYRMGLNGVRNRLVGQQNRTEALAQGRIGGLASGLRGAQMGAMDNDARAAMAQLEAQMYGAERDRAVGYESNRDQALMRLNMGDYSGAAGLYGGLMNTAIGQYNTDRNYDLSERQDARADTAARIDNEAARLKVRQYASELNMNEQLFESELAAKKQQYEAAKQQGREAAWMSENSWWLGPLKAVFNIIPAVAGAAMGR